MGEQDLITLWEAHCRYEFETRDVDATMATMVAEPYVNHIPTMTGGVGRDQLKRFYKYHFVGMNPPDFRLAPISRTVGASCIVDEFIMHFTHTTEMDWILPGVAPTGRAVEIPTMVVLGDNDFIRVSDAVEAAELLPHGQLAVLPATTHMDMTRSPERVLAMIVPFLDA